MIRINKNESPIRALTDEEIASVAVGTRFQEYTDDEIVRLTKAFAAFHGEDPASIAFANGSDEWIQKCTILLGYGPILMLEPDFVMYEEYAAQFQREVIKVPCEEDYSFDYEKVYAVIADKKPSYFIVSQPNNPLGGLHPASFIQKTADLLAAYGGYLILDEAYMDFVEEPPERPVGDHVILLRTLSKIYGLAGLRIGIASSTEKTMKLLNSIAHPYPLNTLSLNMAAYLLEQPEKLRAFMAEQRCLSAKLKKIFKEQAGDVISILPSETNFVFTYGELAPALGQWIIDHGYQPRTYEKSGIRSIEKAVRYSIATEEQLDALAEIIREWREQL
ncbi:pyridoxal phosphate-dependent transferase [Trichococcus palustris]|jgi:histidinol-phosphate aminotransferase|uniref:Pyridoxal phosphate-dependent transferase n=1 Tax=Trichococcus palustris TaxID=140314 RepID=A0A143YK24_9LACT|nr:histidinol-phosphate transaminase [Trichococcus palustris]CZQ90885.1 pyridoxal phosphate-dependent transferase [Trichococcus palustris]SFL19263.1 histidinol-phosphate aminotransferase [Trichococcus palustris]